MSCDVIQMPSARARMRTRHHHSTRPLPSPPAMPQGDEEPLRTWATFGLMCFGAITTAEAEMRKPVPVGEMLIEVVTTSTIQGDRMPGEAQTVFGPTDNLFVHLTLTWEARKLGGLHRFRIIMTRGSEVLSDESKDCELGASPARVWYGVQAAKLGIGELQIEIQVDDLSLTRQLISIA